MTDYYVTTSGDDANAGTSEAAAFATPGKAASVAVDGDSIWVRSGTYTLTTAVQNANGGPVLLPAGVVMEGYGLVIGDRGTRPVIHAGATGTAIICSVAAPGFNRRRGGYCNIEVDGNGVASISGFQVTANYTPLCYLCSARNCFKGFALQNYAQCHECLSVDSAYGFWTTNDEGECVRCVSINGSVGFTSVERVIQCIAAGASGIGFSFGSVFRYSCKGNTAYGCGGDGFRFDYDIGYITDCLAVANGGYGFHLSSASHDPFFLRNASFNNTSGRLQNVPHDRDGIILSSDPFVDAAANDFRLNNTPGGGADCQQIAVPIIGTPATAYIDIGAVSAQATAGGTLIVVDD